MRDARAWSTTKTSRRSKKHSCDVATLYSDRHDSWYCRECDVWTERGCSDLSCQYCTPRPSKPSGMWPYWVIAIKREDVPPLYLISGGGHPEKWENPDNATEFTSLPKAFAVLKALRKHTSGAQVYRRNRRPKEPLV